MQNYQDLPLSTADKLFIVATVADLPANAVESELRWVSDVSQIYVYTGSVWQVASGGIGPASIANTSSINLSATLGVLSATIVDSYVRGLFSATAPITLSAGGVIAMPAATGSVDGYLKQGDWTTFNGKQNALGFTPENIANKNQLNGYAGLDAAGLIDTSHIPPSAIERLVIVANAAARYALTTTIVQNGDTVKQSDTGEMWFVYDDTQLNSDAGYRVYTAGTASAAPWSGITGKPDNLVAIAAMTGPGFVVKTSTDPAGVTYAQRSIAGTANRVGVSNGDGVSGNPTINIDATQFPQAVAGDVGKPLVAGGANSASWSEAQSTLDQQATGLVSWGGSGNYYSYASGTFTVLRAGVGRVGGQKITWAGGESVSGLSASKGYLIGFNSAGVLTATDITTIEDAVRTTMMENYLSVYTNNVILFGIWTDGATPVIVKEDHSYRHNTDISVTEHFRLGQTFSFGGAALSLLSSANRTIQTTGEDAIDDHGLKTRIADAAGAVVDCMAIFQNGSGIAQALNRRTFTVSGITTAPTAGATYTNNGSTFTVVYTTLTGVAPNISGTIATWTSSGNNNPLASGTLTKTSGTGDATIAFSAYATTQTISTLYAPAGVPTSLTTGGSTRYGIVAVYVSKDDKQTPNTTTPAAKYFQLLSSTAYGTTANAANSIGSAASPDMTQFIMPPEMRAIELVLNGFVLVDGNTRIIPNVATNGFVAGVKTVKASIGAAFTAGAVSATTANNVSVDTTAFNGALSGADVNVQLALQTLDDAKANRYNVALSWTGAGPYTMTITGATHGKGVNPIVRVRETVAGVSSVVECDVDITDANGNVLITSSQNFTGNVTIM